MTTSPNAEPGGASGASPTDPFALWKQIYEANERAWSAAIERAMASPTFAQAQGRALETILQAQRAVRDQMRSYLETVNAPTREDIARLGELIVGLEEKVDQLDDRLARLEAVLGAEPPNPVKPRRGRA